MLCTATQVRCFAVPVQNRNYGESWFAKWTNSTRTSVCSSWNPPAVTMSQFCRVDFARRMISKLKKFSKSCLLSGWSMNCFQLTGNGTSEFSIFRCMVGFFCPLKSSSILDGAGFIMVKNNVNSRTSLTEVAEHCSDKHICQLSKFLALAGLPIAWTRACPSVITHDLRCVAGSWFSTVVTDWRICPRTALFGDCGYLDVSARASRTGDNSWEKIFFKSTWRPAPFEMSKRWNRFRSALTNLPLCDKSLVCTSHMIFSVGLLDCCRLSWNPKYFLMRRDWTALFGDCGYLDVSARASRTGMELSTSLDFGLVLSKESQWYAVEQHPSVQANNTWVFMLKDANLFSCSIS